MASNEKDPLVSSEAGYGAAGKKDATNTPQPLMTRIKETLSLFWYLGFVAFGGPTAHVAILRDHLVTVNNFIDEDVFTELFALGAFRISKIFCGWRWCHPTLHPMVFINRNSHRALLLLLYIYRSGTPRSKFYSARYFDSFDSRWSDFRSDCFCLLVSSRIHRAFSLGFVPI